MSDVHDETMLACRTECSVKLSASICFALVFISALYLFVRF